MSTRPKSASVREWAWLKATGGKHSKSPGLQWKQKKDKKKRAQTKKQKTAQQQQHKGQKKKKNPIYTIQQQAMKRGHQVDTDLKYISDRALENTHASMTLLSEFLEVRALTPTRKVYKFIYTNAMKFLGTQIFLDQSHDKHIKGTMDVLCQWRNSYVVLEIKTLLNSISEYREKLSKTSTQNKKKKTSQKEYYHQTHAAYKNQTEIYAWHFSRGHEKYRLHANWPVIGILVYTSDDGIWPHVCFPNYVPPENVYKTCGLIW